MRGNEPDLRRHIGKINDNNDYVFLGLGCKDFTFLQDNIKKKCKEDKDTTWSEDIYKHIVMTQDKPKEENSNIFKQIVDFMFVQMSASKGLKIFEERVVATLFREYKYFHDMDVFNRVKIDDMSSD